MADNTLSQTLEILFKELIDGAPGNEAWMLNGGDVGLLRSLDRLTASAASEVHAGGASIAAHVDHLRYGLALMNRWSQGEQNPWATADWAASWDRLTVNDQDWASLRKSLADEARAWAQTIRTPRDYSLVELNGVVSSIAHLAYHFGSIRQMNRSIKGPSAR